MSGFIDLVAGEGVNKNAPLIHVETDKHTFTGTDKKGLGYMKCITGNSRQTLKTDDPLKEKVKGRGEAGGCRVKTKIQQLNEVLANASCGNTHDEMHVIHVLLRK